MKLEIIQKSNPTSDSVTIRFKKPKDILYKAGQHGLFTFKINNEAYRRSYSFHTAPDIDSDLAITIRSVENGMVSNLLVQNGIGEVHLEGVTGEFFVEPSPEIKRHLVMFAGGSGITPIISMIRSVIHKEPMTTISLIYSNQTYERIIFRDELATLEEQFPDRIKLHNIITQGGAPASFSVIYNDRLSKLVTKKLIKNILSGINYSVEYYLSGPFAFMQVADEAIRSLNSDKVTIYKEHFYIPENEDSKFNFNNLPSREIIIQLKNEEKHLVVQGGNSILQSALENSISLAHSCTEGKCGVCRARIISGDVKLRKNHILTPEEIQSGQILLCQGFPVSDNVIVRPIN